MVFNTWLISVTAGDVLLDDNDPILLINVSLYTKSATFKITGQVTLSDKVHINANIGRDGRMVRSVGGHLLHLLGGFLTHTSTTNHVPSWGHPAPQSPLSVFQNLLTGFSHSAYVMFGQHHNHQYPFYFYTTHGGNFHRHPGASLHFHNGALRFFVHTGHHQFHLNVNFNFKPWTNYHIASSFRYVGHPFIELNKM